MKVEIVKLAPPDSVEVDASKFMPWGTNEEKTVKSADVVVFETSIFSELYDIVIF